MRIVVWFTGLSGSGKSTIAEALKKKLQQQNKSVEILDGDVVRNTIHKKFSFSREDIRENNKLIAELARKSTVDIVLVPIISPYREDRMMAKSIIGKEFVEVFINCPLEQCIKKDVKGLYKKALAGEINDFIGIATSNPYEYPENPDIEIKTDVLSVDESVHKILTLITDLLKE